jgi:hypothetical protein
VVADPQDPTTLYVGTYQDGAFRITDADGSSPQVQSITSSPAEVEELAFTQGSSPILYCACGKAGIYRAQSPYSTWNAVNDGIETGPAWSAVAVADTSGDIYAGSVDPSCDANDHCGSIKLLDPGPPPEWDTVPTDENGIHIEVGGSGGPNWWLAHPDHGEDRFLLAHSLYRASMLVASGDSVMVVGRAGAWFSTNQGANWYPYVRGLGVTVNGDVATSPDSDEAARLYVASTDWGFMHSSDHGTTMGRRVPATDSGYAMTLDEKDTSGTLDAFIASGGLDTGPGEASHMVDPVGDWDDLGLNTELEAGCDDPPPMPDPIGVAVGRTAGGSTVVIVAVDNCGLWRRVGGSWTQVADPSVVMGNQGGINQAPMVWPDWSPSNDPNVYVFDQDQGALFRSSNYGAAGSWGQVWPPSDLGQVGPWAGYVAADPTVTGQLWVTTGLSGGTYLLESAHEPMNMVVTKFDGSGAPAYPGPVAVKLAGGSPRRVYVVGRTTGVSGFDPEIWYSDNSGTNWSTFGTDDYRAAVIIAMDVAASRDGYAYVGTSGQGVVVNTDV